MYRAFKTSLETKSETTATVDEIVAMLIENEWDDRHNRNIGRVMRNACFRYNATIEQLDYNAERAMNKNQIHRLTDGEFIRKKEDLLKHYPLFSIALFGYIKFYKVYCTP